MNWQIKLVFKITLLMLGSAFLMLLWNLTMVTIFRLPYLPYWGAMSILVMCRIVYGYSNLRLDD